MEGLDFKGALRSLAERAGVALDDYNPKEKDANDRLFQLLEEATLFFQVHLIKHKEALAYLYGRGLKPDTLKEFRVGFAPDGWRVVHEHLGSKGFTDEEMEKAGLVIRSEKGFYDRFRSRIMFPLSDSAGRVVAFSGRIFGKEDDKTGKYVNSPETALFNKSHILYGYDKAKQDIRTQRTAILVEGQVDLLMAHQAGMKNTVAVSGTAFSEHHAKLLERLAEKLILAFDTDDAGRAAAIRAAKAGLAHGLDVRAVVMPSGTDPAEVIAKDTPAWSGLVAEALHIVHFLLDRLAEENPDKRSFRLAVGEQILPVVKYMSNSIDQAHFVGEIASRAGINEDAAWNELSKISIQETSPKAVSVTTPDSAPAHSRQDVLAEQIVSILLWQESIEKPPIDVASWKEKLKKLLGDARMEKLYTIPEDEKRERIFEAELYFGKERDVVAELEEIIGYLGQEHMKEVFTQAIEDLRVAEQSGDKEQIDILLKKCQELSRELSNTTQHSA